MSLFIKPILDFYNVMEYDNDFLLLHCSRNDFVKAPFDGEIKVADNGCILCKDKHKLHISHINVTKDGEVQAGDIIGRPMVGMGKRNIAYIGVKIYVRNKLDNIMTYLNHKDKYDNIEKKPRNRKQSYKKSDNKEE